MPRCYRWLGVVVCGLLCCVLKPSTRLWQATREVEKQVEKLAASIIQHCKANHCQFQDPDFGPSDEDEYGARALYGNPPVAPGSAGGSKYPPPESLRWDRPQYLTDELDSQHDTQSEEDATAEDNELEDFYDDATVSDEGAANVWCTEGQLFVDGSSSGDVIQGSLGDCWFLGALSVLATQEDLLRSIFWKGDKFKEYGFFVLRFFKDTSVCYVFIGTSRTTVSDRLLARIPKARSASSFVLLECSTNDFQTTASRVTTTEAASQRSLVVATTTSCGCH